jgi:hypothetical protein
MPMWGFYTGCLLVVPGGSGGLENEETAWAERTLAEEIEEADPGKLGSGP